MARGTTPLKRGKALGPGKKTKAKRASMRSALEWYFAGLEQQRCQLSGAIIYPGTAVAHHKTPRSELRKAGIKDLDAPERLLILHRRVHIKWLHANKQGRPKEWLEADRYKRIEESSANALNGQHVHLSEQDRFDLTRFLAQNGI